MLENLKRAIIQTIKENLKGYILIVGVFFAGMTLSYVLNISSGAEEEIKLYLNDFISTVKAYSTDSNKTFTIAMSSYLKLYFVLFLMSVSAIGSIGILICVFVKGFSYGIVFSAVFSMMGPKAILLFFSVIFPHILVLVPFFISYSFFCLKNAYGISKGLKSFRNNILMPFIYGGVCLIFSGIAALIQSYLEPVLLRIMIWKISKEYLHDKAIRAV